MAKSKAVKKVKRVPVKLNPHRVSDAVGVKVRELLRTVDDLHQNLLTVMERERKALISYAKLAGEVMDSTAANFFTVLPTTLEVPLPGFFNDSRGSIKRLSDKSVGSVQVITSHAGTRRASHWHREDSHLCFVVSGEIEYLERPVGSTEPPTSQIFREGHQFFTGPEVEHEMLFPKDTVFVVLANRHRTPEEYEKDLVRLKSPLKLMPGEAVPVDLSVPAP